VAASEPLYSATQVKKAGKYWARLIQGGAAQVDIDTTEIVRTHKIIAWWRGEHAYPLAMVNASLRHYVADYDSQVTQRLKKHSTMIDKLVRHPAMDLTRMEDIGGCRVTLPTVAEVERVVRYLRKNWNRTITRHRNYVAEPKDDGYRAHHLVISKRGHKIEIQIRTKRQDLWANAVEYDSRQVKVDLKSGYGPDDVHEYYRAMSDLFAHADAGTTPPAELSARLQALHSRVAPFLSGVSSEIAP
jgi:putative GTP pyrophosphokinase